ncbi:MAG: isochorismate synthase [Deltaproteobacteria bacterium]|nr:isochorismate synthase [Deltaproteobacteria bacterium]
MEITDLSPPRLSTAEHERLSDLVKRALDRARGLNRPLLLSYAFDMGGADLLGLLAGLGHSGDFRFYWEKPSDGLAMTAGGMVRRFTAGGAQRFSSLGRVVHEALKDALCGGEEEGPQSGPFLLGGFSFFDTLGAADWPGFDPAQLVAPAWLVRQDRTGTLALVSTEVEPREQPGPVVSRLAVLMGHLRQLALTVGRSSTTLLPPNPVYHQQERADGKTAWLEVVRKAREAIRTGSLAKVVLARALDLVCEGSPSPFTMLRRLRETYPHCYTFFVDPGHGQGFLGASPEQFARFQGRTVSMVALAGTMPRGSNPREDEAYGLHLLHSRKERAEHRFVVEGITSAVSPFGHVSHPEEPRLLKLNNLQHLITPVSLELEQPMDVLELMERLHPTPAVGGYPTEAALSLIPRLELFDRGWYAAPVGWLNARGEGEFAVALRSGILRDRQIRLFAGGGIVADSEPEKEFEETRIKFQPLLGALARD